MHADSTQTHNGTTSGLGSAIGVAVNTTSCRLIGLSCGSPIYGNWDTLATTIVDKFIGAVAVI